MLRARVDVPDAERGIHGSAGREEVVGGDGKTAYRGLMPREHGELVSLCAMHQEGPLETLHGIAWLEAALLRSIMTSEQASALGEIAALDRLGGGAHVGGVFVLKGSKLVGFSLDALSFRALPLRNHTPCPARQGERESGQQGRDGGPPSTPFPGSLQEARPSRMNGFPPRKRLSSSLKERASG